MIPGYRAYIYQGIRLGLITLYVEGRFPTTFWFHVLELVFVSRSHMHRQAFSQFYDGGHLSFCGSRPSVAGKHPCMDYSGHLGSATGSGAWILCWSIELSFLCLLSHTSWFGNGGIPLPGFFAIFLHFSFCSFCPSWPDAIPLAFVNAFMLFFLFVARIVSSARYLIALIHSSHDRSISNLTWKSYLHNRVKIMYMYHKLFFFCNQHNQHWHIHVIRLAPI